MSKNKSEKLVMIGRVGYAAKTIVYAMPGVLIIWAAFSSVSAENVSKERVFQEVYQTQFGTIALIVLILGLVCYVVWRLIQTVLNPGTQDEDAKDYGMRVFYFVSW